MMTAFRYRKQPSYETQGPSSGRRFVTGGDGQFFLSHHPALQLSNPTDGPVGEMILQTRRHPMRPAPCALSRQCAGLRAADTHVLSKATVSGFDVGSGEERPDLQNQKRNDR